MTHIAYDPALVDSVASHLELRRPNRDALDALARSMDTASVGARLVADLATGVGKTYVAAGLLDYLQEAGVRNVVIITPGSTIQRKTVANLTPGSPRFIRGMSCAPTVITIDDVERGVVAQALDDPNTFKVFVLTVQSLLRPDTKENRRAHRPHEMLGVALSDYLASCGDLVVIADEHHVYYSGSAKKFEDAITSLHPQVMIGLTATPHESTPAEQIVYRYPLAEAIADGYVKVPVLVARPDGVADLRTQLADGVALLDAKAAALREFCQQVPDFAFVEPVMFIVASTIDEASNIRDMLTGPDLLGSDDKVLLVTSEEPDATLQALDAIEQPTSGVRAVVSVAMLKEGWDVKNIYVIASVRSMASQLLTEQVLGRGLRLPFGRRTGVGMLDTVEVLAHQSFATLLEDAQVLLSQTLGERAAAASATAIANPGVGEQSVAVSDIGSDPSASDAQHVSITLPGLAAPDAASVEPSLFDDIDDQPLGMSHQVGGLATVASRLADAQATTTTLGAPLVARAVGGVRVPLFIPRVTTRWERDAFTLASIELVAVEALGRTFADDNAPTLTRKSLDAVRDGDSVRIEVHDRTNERVAASQQTLEYNAIETDIAERLLATNDIAQTSSEYTAASAIAQAFMRGADVTEDTPWRVEHGRLATEALVNFIRTKQTSKPARLVTEVTQVRWPDPLDIILTAPPTSRHLVTSARKFVRAYPYSGWTRSVYETVSFDAFSTEFKLAELFDTSPGVQAWVRVTASLPLGIPYHMSAIQRIYLPDFIVIDDAGVRWIVEGKADSEMTDPIVIAKRDAARDWVQAVNASPDVPDRWGYLLASETAIAAAANTWSALRAGSQSFGG